MGGQSYGTLKLLELGCALATDPDVLLLDEPTSGMGPDESDELGDRLLLLRKEFGLTILVIEHHVPLVLRVCDHVYVLNFGRLLAEGEPSFIQTHPEVVAAYLGGEDPEALAATHETDEDAALDAQLAGSHHHVDEAPTEVLPAPEPEPESEPESAAHDVAEEPVPPNTPRPRKRKALTAAEQREKRAAAATKAPRRRTTKGSSS